MSKPLADAIRPQNFDDFVGQQHILGEGKVLRKIAESGKIPNMIFYGPPGTGKTTAANIIAKKTDKLLYKLNAVNASIADIKEVIAQTGTFGAQNGILLYLDEIQNFNKKQQQSLLEVIENGAVTLIASTTENPYFYVYNAILSRSTVFEFKPVSVSEIKKAVVRATVELSKEIPIEFSKEAIEHIAHSTNGDVRGAIGAVELASICAKYTSDGKAFVDLEVAIEATQKKTVAFDKGGDNQYDVMSGLQKSIRGSDPDAAVHYLARLIAAGDLASACRRLMVIACEDVGLAYPTAITVVKSCVDAALQLGLPEARIPLAEAAIFLATAPKSNSAYMAINNALYDVENTNVGEMPRALQNKHCDGEGNAEIGQNYLYPHDYPNHYVKQQYLPENIKNKKYYEYGDNKNENAAKEYWNKIKKD